MGRSSWRNFAREYLQEDFPPAEPLQCHQFLLSSSKYWKEYCFYVEVETSNISKLSHLKITWNGMARFVKLYLQHFLHGKVFKLQ